MLRAVQTAPTFSGRKQSKYTAARKPAVLRGASKEAIRCGARSRVSICWQPRTIPLPHALPTLTEPLREGT